MCDRKVGYLVLYWIFIMQKTSSTAARVSKSTRTVYLFFFCQPCLFVYPIRYTRSFETNFSTASNQSPMSVTDFTIQIVLTMASLVCINGNPISMEISCLSMLFFSPTRRHFRVLVMWFVWSSDWGCCWKKNKQRGESFFWTSLL